LNFSCITFDSCDSCDSRTFIITTPSFTWTFVGCAKPYSRKASSTGASASSPMVIHCSRSSAG